MAELTIADKKAIFGDEYAEIEARELAASRNPVTDDERRRALSIQMEQNEVRRHSAGAVAFTGLLLLLGSLYRTGAIDIAGWLGIGGTIVGSIWYVWLRRDAARWKQKLGQGQKGRGAAVVRDGRIASPNEMRSVQGSLQKAS